MFCEQRSTIPANLKPLKPVREAMDLRGGRRIRPWLLDSTLFLFRNLRNMYLTVLAEKVRRHSSRVIF